MADSLLLRSLKGKPKQVTLSSKKLVMLPKIIGKIESVVQLQLQNNRLKTLPMEMENLYQVRCLKSTYFRIDFEFVLYDFHKANIVIKQMFYK